tara:strand:- start:65 stop:685 length:621 start_codon:yes stop_codon:yes gene_type:complete
MNDLIVATRNVVTTGTAGGNAVTSISPIFNEYELTENKYGETQQDRDMNLLAVKHSNRPVVNYQGSKVINLCLSCVYILFYQKEMVYIGESKNPNQRIGNHVKDKVFDGYRILPTNRRKYWEKILIKRYAPKYNKHKDYIDLPTTEEEKTYLSLLKKHDGSMDLFVNNLSKKLKKWKKNFFKDIKQRNQNHKIIRTINVRRKNAKL